MAELSQDKREITADLLRRARNMCLRVVSEEYEEAKRIVAELDALPLTSATRAATPCGLCGADILVRPEARDG